MIAVPNQENKIEVLEGYHFLKINHKIVENPLGRKHASLTLGYFTDRNNLNRIEMQLSDSVKNKSGTVILVYIPGEMPNLKWTLTNQEGVRLISPGKPKFDPRFTLPESMMLYKER